MKTCYSINIIGGTILGTTMILGTALANPALLPDHPGHPMKPIKSPVTGQLLANDPGRSLWYEEKALEKAVEKDNNRTPEFKEKDTNVDYKGAGTLPGLAKGYPHYKINPPVKSAIDPNR